MRLYLQQVFILLYLNTLSWTFANSEEPLKWPSPDSYDLSFQANEAMLEFLDQIPLSNLSSDMETSRRIVEHLFGKDGTGFVYEARTTLAPNVALNSRKGNCITFAMLFTTLAREAGLTTHFNELNNSPGWNQSGELVIETGHVNVRVESKSSQHVIEWLDNYRDLSLLGGTLQSDDHIRSEFFNNLAIQALAAEAFDSAFEYFQEAKSYDPQNPSVWQNLGVYWLRRGNVQEAEQAFIRGVSYAGERSTVSFLLAQLYQDLGKTKLASKYLKRAESHARKNPFYHYRKALDAIAEKQFAKAIKPLDRAILKLPDYYLFHHTKAQCYLELDDIHQWRTSLEKAIALTHTPQIKEQLEALLMAKNDHY